MDGTDRGIFFANLREQRGCHSGAMPTLAYHEGVPDIIGKIFHTERN